MKNILIVNGHQYYDVVAKGELTNKIIERATDFFKQNGNIFNVDERFVKAFFKNYIKDSNIRTFAEQQYVQVTKKLLSSTTIGQGRVYLIAIPKKTLEDPNTCYVWRAHPFGPVCTCSHGSSKKGHEQFIEILNPQIFLYKMEI